MLTAGVRFTDEYEQTALRRRPKYMMRVYFEAATFHFDASFYALSPHDIIDIQHFDAP